ncbi:unnamed protein product [Didymodactylos carnosus]|uniref:Uncharacterized protein n=1 Tax=Didymodactylos carnosus TaxID=1234261 RepID=A0A813VZS3_9BILA|nr:unnamed protein product [Didymodactylos carnosus]CAF1540085.1 unnamed protein product [Didymodactylos carnosus]CAF3632517.1 unnamed protein product [Didymodactylos carnosus]CAF4328310.1 unnamed protein product [Didymodactylos carnosus]
MVVAAVQQNQQKHSSSLKRYQEEEEEEEEGEEELKLKLNKVQQSTVNKCDTSQTVDHCSSSSITSLSAQHFNSESTGFQQSNLKKNSSKDKIKTNLWSQSAYPKFRKLTANMEIHRQRFSQLNPHFERFFQYKTTANPIQQSLSNDNDFQTIYPQISSNIPRPPQRQKARSRQQNNHFFSSQKQQLLKVDDGDYQQQEHKPIPTFRRYNSATKLDYSDINSNKKECITLANLTKVLHILQNRATIGETTAKSNSDKSDTTTTSSQSSVKQRVQQHLQNTASRWWKQGRSSTTMMIPTDQNTAPSSATIQQQHEQPQDFLPVLTIVNANHPIYPQHPPARSKSSRRFSSRKTPTISTNIHPAITPIPSTNVIHSKGATIQQHQEPLIMSTKGVRLHATNQQLLNYIQRQRLVRQP